MRTINAKNVKVLRANSKLARSRKGHIGIVTGFLMLVGFGALVGAAGYGVYKLANKDSDDSAKQTLAVVQDENGKSVVVDQTTQTILNQNNCGDNGITYFDAYVINPLDDDGTATYHSVALKIQGGGSSALKTYTTDADGTFAASSLTTNCGFEYSVYAPAVKNGSASGMWEASMDSPNFDDTYEVEQLDHISINAYDNKNKAYVYDSSDATNSDFEEITSSSGVTFKSTTNNATAYAMSNGGSLDFEFRLKVGTTQRSWGDLKNYLVLDADKSDFAKPVVTFEGKTLEVVELAKSGMNADDVGYLSGYEYAVVLPADITEVEKTMGLKINAKSGQDPDVDVVGKFVAESYYVDGTTVQRGIFNSGGTEILMAPGQKFTIDIS